MSGRFKLCVVVPRTAKSTLPGMLTVGRIVALRRGSAEQPAQLLLGPVEDPFLRRRQVFAGAIDVEIKHRHGGQQRRALAPLASFRGALQRHGDPLRIVRVGWWRADSSVDRHQAPPGGFPATITDAAATDCMAAKLAKKGPPDPAPAIGALAKWNEGRRRKACSHLDKVWKEFRGATPFW